MKKSGIILVLVFLGIVAIAAQVSAQDAGSGASGVVRVGSWDSGDGLIPWEAAIASFEAENPDIDVQLESVPQEYGTRLLAQFASGTAPDIFMTGDGDVSRFVALGAVENLDPYIDGDSGFDRETLYPAVAAFGDVQGSTYYLTKDYSPLVLYYNVDQLAEAGIDAPSSEWTWDDILAAAQQLTIDGNGNNATSPDFDPENIQRWGLQLPNDWGEIVWARGVVPIMAQNGATMVSEDGTTMDGYINSPEAVEAFQWFADLFLVHHVAPTTADVAAFSGVDLFESGLVSMKSTGVWPLSGYVANGTVNLGTSGLPAGPAGNANALCWSGFAMYSGSENKDAAWEFLKYIGAGEGAASFAEYAMTPVQAIAEEQGRTEDQYYGPIMADLANVKPIPESTTQFWGECGNAAFVEQFNRVFTEGLSVQEAADAAAEQGDACLAERAAAAGEMATEEAGAEGAATEEMEMTPEVTAEG
jgi:multiple sugar transport system substrate-binding protein